MHLKALIAIFFSFLLSTSFGQDSLVVPKKKYYTKHITEELPKIDGLLNDAAWQKVAWAGDFLEYQPNEGLEPRQQTKFKLVYSEKFVFIGIRAYDSQPDSLVQRMSRRDEFPGDWVEVNLDTYHDLRSAFSFTISVSGVRGDEFISKNGDDWDDSWNPIWSAKTNVDKEGWTAEMKIPLSQLRFGKNSDKIWGLQVTRLNFREQARSTWQPIPRESGVWVSGFGEIHGLDKVIPQKQVEIAPYVVLKTERSEKIPENPYRTGVKNKMTVGLDGKYAVTSDLILDFTINPDFGQVEADPSQVRIDGFQNFFKERRPFFVESKNIYDFEITGSSAGGDYDSDLLFYSRRIGSQPHGYPNINGNEHSDSPQFTSILGATKFSGKTKKGLSIGILESITANEYSKINNNGTEREELVEPLSNYFVSRVQQDFKGGETILGGIFTSVNRTNNLNSLLHDNAFSGGIDLLHFWKNRTYYFKASSIFSNVQGTAEKIYDTQTSFEHLFQRPGNTGLTLDSTRTSLTGTGGTFRIGKSGGKKDTKGRIINFDSGITYRSPELELNDMGFMQTANEINHFTWVGLQWQNPTKTTRSKRLNYNHFFKWDMAGQFLFQLFNVNGHLTFNNNWSVGSGLTWNTFDISNTALRGGASLRRPPGVGNWAYFQSDERKKMQLFSQINWFNGQNKVIKSRSIEGGFSYQPSDALNIQLEVGYSTYYRLADQYVSQVSHNNQTKTIVSGVDQNTLNYTLRLNYNITPDLTIQFYGQPYITKPIYSNFSWVSNPTSKQYASRFSTFSEQQISFANNTYSVDENLDGITDYSFDNPNFNFSQFRSNLVARWEYRPGSELYLVWSNNNTRDLDINLSTGIQEDLFNDMFNQKGTNIFLIKYTYRFLK